MFTYTELIKDIIANAAIIGVGAYLTTQLAVFRRTLGYRLYRKRDKAFLIIVFGFFSALGNTFGIPLMGSLVNTRIVWAIVGGLLGGPVVGLGVGIVGAFHRYFMGGFTMWAAVLSNVLVGYLSGLVFRRYGPRGVTVKIAMITAVCGEAILKIFILIMSQPFEAAWEFEKLIAIPTTVANSLSVGLFLYIVRDVFGEQEKYQARSAQQAMRVICKTSRLLRRGLTEEVANKLAYELYYELKPAAVAITGATNVLAFLGCGSDHHVKGKPIVTAATALSKERGQTVIAKDKSGIGCPHPNCPLTAVVDAPLMVNNEFMGSIKIFRANKELVLPYEIELIQGIADFLSLQLAYFKMDEQARLLAQAEYNILKAQINPHFLFNTLATIRSLIRTDPDTARVLIKDLSDLLRKTLASNREIIGIREELDTVYRYIRLEKARFGERIKVVEMIPQDILEYNIPVFSIQPIVENAIKHGLTNKKSGGTVSIRAWHNDHTLFIEVADDGVGIDVEKLSHLLEDDLIPINGTGESIGIHNVNNRLKHIYEGQGGLRMTSEKGVGTKVEIFLPWVPSRLIPGDVVIGGENNE